MELRAVHAFGYVVTRGLRGMLQAPLVQLLAIATISVCMLLLGAVCLTWVNARSVVDSWGVDVPVSVYLVDGVDDAELGDLRGDLETLPEVASVRAVGPEAAMDRLVEGLGGDPALVAGIEPAILPTSLEVQLRDDADPGFAPALAERLEDFEIVDEVAVAGAWVARVDAMLSTLRMLAFGAAAGVGFACLAIVWSTIRLGVYARRAEIQILRLVGGTATFVSGPFVVEGVVQGAAGAAVAILGLHLGWGAMEPYLSQGLSLVFAAGSLRFFNLLEIAAGVGFGAFVGLLGSRAAVARYVEA